MKYGLVLAPAFSADKQTVKESSYGLGLKGQFFISSDVIEVFCKNEKILDLFQRTFCDIAKAKLVLNAASLEPFGDVCRNRNRCAPHL